MKKDERIVWFLRIVQAILSNDTSAGSALLGSYMFSSFEKLLTDVSHFFGFQDHAIENFQFQRKPVSEVLASLSKLEDDWKKKQNLAKPVVAQTGDKVIFDFKDGYQWWLLDRAYCPEEGRSGQHCGNVTGQHKTDQRILSLRNNGHVVLTFILEPDGNLGEMKANGYKFGFRVLGFVHLLQNAAGIDDVQFGVQEGEAVFKLLADFVLYFGRQVPEFLFEITGGYDSAVYLGQHLPGFCLFLRFSCSFGTTAGQGGHAKSESGHGNKFLSMHIKLLYFENFDQSFGS